MITCDLFSNFTINEVKISASSWLIYLRMLTNENPKQARDAKTDNIKETQPTLFVVCLYTN